VSPTRALVNDLYHRLEAPTTQLGCSLIRRTGEHKQVPPATSGVLLTTPESFDSMLCRGRSRPRGHVLASVRAVVLDEIHLTFGSARGAQLSWLVRRLRRLRTFAFQQQWVPDPGVQVVALSATVADPQSVASTYLIDPHTAIVPGQRTIEQDTGGGEGPTEEALPRRLAQDSAPAKVLVFCNTRRRVDTLAAELREPLERLGYRVQAHHGSLSRSVREEAESDVRLSGAIVVFATSTLEFGIDIGDIDLVVLDAPPPDVASVLQRIGRGNRRRDRTSVMCCARSCMDRLLHDAMLNAARAGDLGPACAGAQHAVARQQLASYLFQSPSTSRSRDGLLSLATECAPDLDAPRLLDHLVRSGEFAEAGDRVRLGEGWLERAASGEIHSNIESTPGAAVVDAVTGQVLADGIRSQTGPTIGVGGKKRPVKGRTDFRIEVGSAHDRAQPAGEWRYVTSRRFIGASQPYTVRKMLEIPTHRWPTLTLGGFSVAFHLSGAEMAAVLDLLQPAGMQAEVNPWYVAVPEPSGRKPKWIAEPDTLGLSARLEQQVERIEGMLARPYANRHLPMAIRIDELESWLRLPSTLEDVVVAEWVEVQPRVKQVLSELL
jgi:ATP-dependent Lhr-like helicase